MWQKSVTFAPMKRFDPRSLWRPVVWVCRFRHRRGYGVHSPFAFQLITRVFYERGEFYAYRPLAAVRRTEACGLSERLDRLMLRLVNDVQPRRVVLWGDAVGMTRRYVEAGCRRARIDEVGCGALPAAKDYDMLYARRPADGLALFEAFGKGENAFAYLVSKGTKSYNIQSGRGKSDFVRYLSPFLQSTASSVELDSYIQSLSILLSVSEESIRADIASQDAGASVAEEDERGTIDGGKPRRRRFNPAAVSIDLFAMLYLSNHRELFPEYRPRISFGDLKDREAQVIYMALENAMRNEIASNELFLTMISDEDARNDVATSFALDEYSQQGGRSALDEAADRISLRGMEERRDVLLNQLRSFPDSLDPEQLAEALQRKKELDEKIGALREELFSSTAKEE